jgi:DNA-directed RNA polymerase specialized sigma24 family protein
LPVETPPVARTERAAPPDALISAVQNLPLRQRAALVLRDVLGFRAAGIANMLDARFTEPRYQSWCLSPLYRRICLDCVVAQERS